MHKEKLQMLIPQELQLSPENYENSSSNPSTTEDVNS